MAVWSLGEAPDMREAPDIWIGPELLKLWAVDLCGPGKVSLESESQC